MSRLLLADGVIDLDRAVVDRGEVRHKLTPNERELLLYLASRIGRDVSRDELHRRVWGHAARVVSRAVTLTVHRLRRKIEPSPDAPTHLVTGQAGYRWVPLRSRTEAPRGRVVLVLGQRVSPGGASWLVGCADLAREHDAYLVEVSPDRVLYATGGPDGSRAVAEALLRTGPIRIGRAAGEAERLVDPLSGRTLYGGEALARATRRARDAAVGVLDPLDGAAGSDGEAPGHPATFARIRRLIGRDRALEDLRGLCAGLGPRGILALVGPAGVGKTRLAEELALGPGVGGLLIALEDARTLEGAVREVVRALGIRSVPDPAGAVGAALATRGADLVVLDGIDGALSELGAVLTRWKAAAPDLRLVVTCRERPALDDVVLFELEGLPRAAGAALLRACCPGLPEALDLGDLVDRLDGLPLALQLIAPRLRVVSVGDIEARPERLLDLLARPSGEGRHRSMRAALDVSWGRLDPHERRMLVRATAFAGPFRLDDAEAVLADADPDAPWFVDTLQSLCDRFWVQREAPDGRPRFRLLGVVRAFARGHGDLMGDARQRHARHIASRWRDLSPLGPPPFDPALLPELERAARTAIAEGSAALAGHLVLGYAHAALFHGGVRAALDLADEASTLSPAPRLAARLARSRSQLLRQLGRGQDALIAVDGAITIARSLGEADLIGRALVQRGLVLMSLRAFEEARAAFDAARPLVEDAEATLALRLNRAALCHATRAYAEGLEVVRPLLAAPEPAVRGAAMGMAGAMHLALGALDEAVRWLSPAIVALEAQGEHFQGANFRLLLAEALTESDRDEEAAEAFRAALDTLRRLGGVAWTLVTCAKLAVLAIRRGDLSEAQRWADEGDRWAEECADRRPRAMLQSVRCELRARAGDLDGARAAMAAARALMADRDDPETRGYLAIHRAMAAIAAGSADGAAAELAGAEQIVAQLGAKPHSGLAREARRVRRALQGLASRSAG